MENTYSIAITYGDEENNQLLTLGGAAWCSQREWNNEWDRIPANGGQSRYIADKVDEDDDIVDDRYVDRETVEALLSESIEQLIEKARECIRKTR